MALSKEELKRADEKFIASLNTEESIYLSVSVVLGLATMGLSLGYGHGTFGLLGLFAGLLVTFFQATMFKLGHVLIMEESVKKGRPVLSGLNYDNPKYADMMMKAYVVTIFLLVVGNLATFGVIDHFLSFVASFR